MSIVVFWLEPGGEAAHAGFAESELLAALRFSEERRKEGRHHVCISTEFGDRVGPSGVSAIVKGRLPSGDKYEFSKAHRGAGPTPEDRKR